MRSQPTKEGITFSSRQGDITLLAEEKISTHTHKIENTIRRNASFNAHDLKIKSGSTRFTADNHININASDIMTLSLKNSVHTCKNAILTGKQSITRTGKDLHYHADRQLTLSSDDVLTLCTTQSVNIKSGASSLIIKNGTITINGSSISINTPTYTGLPEPKKL